MPMTFRPLTDARFRNRPGLTCRWTDDAAIAAA
jgi:hypothetical protein